MEVGCSRIWGLVPTTQNQVIGTPHMPALPATQARAPSTTPDPKSSNHHTEQWVQWKNKLYERHLLPWLGRGGREKTRKHTSTNAPNAEPSKNHEDMLRRMHNMQRSRWPLELPEDTKKATWKYYTHTLKRLQATPPKILIKPNANAMQRHTTPCQTNCATCSWSSTKLNCI